jgi:hypothetical protein
MVVEGQIALPTISLHLGSLYYSPLPTLVIVTIAALGAKNLSKDSDSSVIREKYTIK